MSADVLLRGSLDHEMDEAYSVILDVENTEIGVGELCGTTNSE